MPRERLVLQPADFEPRVPKERPLTARAKQFAREYAVDLNAIEAYKRAGFSVNQPQVDAYRLLGDSRIQELISQYMAEKRERNHISADEALMYHFDRSRVTIPLLTRTGCCRHCHGQDHRYQFTLDEYRTARQKHIDRMRTLAERHRREFDDLGGTGFDPYKPVWSKANGYDDDCPECWGRGFEYPMTMAEIEASLSKEQRELINGYSISVDGRTKGRVIKFEFQDRFKHAALAYDLAALIRPVKPIDKFAPAEMTEDQLEEVVRIAEQQGLLTDQRNDVPVSTERPQVFDVEAEEVTEESQ
jgi:phage terminase small subunit